jgi:predicted ester cyclase
VAEGDKVVTLWSFRGTHQGELVGMPASSNQVTIKGMSMDRISGGKFVETWDMYDALGMMQQIGAISSPEQQAQA